MNLDSVRSATADPDTSSSRDPRGGRPVLWSRISWGAAILAAAVFVYRVATFRPLALDAPGTLRPVLYRWFLWFISVHAHPEQAFSTWSTACFAACLIPPALVILAYGRQRWRMSLPRRLVDLLGSRSLLFLAMAAALFLCRYPMLLENELNPDEGQFIASAHKLFIDPDYFRSVDCGTSGPLNIYPLMLPAVLGFSPDYASSRVISLIAEFLALYLFYRAVLLLAPDYLARLATLPLFAAFAVFKHPDLVDYNSEHIPLVLIALSLCCVVRVLHDPRRHRWPLFYLGLLACAAFFTKMQALPMIAALGVIATAYVYATKQQRRLWLPPLIFLAGVAPLAIANAAICLATGVWRDFWMAYIVTNGRYADFGGTLITDLPPFIEYVAGPIELRYFLFTFFAIAGAYAVQRRRHATSERADFLQMAGVAAAVIIAATFLKTSSGVANYTFAAFVTCLLIAAYLLLSYRRNWLGTDPIAWFGLTAAVLIAAALFSIYKAHRTFPHYLLFLFLPVCTAIAWMLLRHFADARAAEPAATQAPSRQRFAFPLLILLLTMFCQSFVWGSQDDQAFKRVAYTVRPLEGPLISAMTEPDDQIVVWGWTVRPYLGSGRVPATRDTNMANFFRWPEITAYYRDRFLRDLKQSPAELFIDAVGPTSWAFNDRQWHRFDEFPEIKAYIDRHYVHLADLYEQRYFLRRDLVGKRRLPFVRDLSLCEAGALRCVDPSTGPTRLLPRVHLPGHALVEIHFTPSGAQSRYATLFSNQPADGSCRGFYFYHLSNDSYRLALGVGSDWIYSKELSLPPGEAASLWIEFNGSIVTIRQNGDLRDQMYLPRPVVDSDESLALGAAPSGEQRFAGAISLFQITDLARVP